MLNLSVLIESSAFSHGDRPAFTFGDTTLTYTQVNAAANQVGEWINFKRNQQRG